MYATYTNFYLISHTLNNLTPFSSLYAFCSNGVSLLTPIYTYINSGKRGMQKKFLKNIGECEFEYHLTRVTPATVGASDPPVPFNFKVKAYGNFESSRVQREGW